MDIEQKEQLTGYRDNSDQAISRRLVAARTVAGYSQKDFAPVVGLIHTTYATQEKKGRPSLKVMRYLYRNHSIDFNFILNGDFQQLPHVVQLALFEALQGILPDYDLRSSSS